MDDTLDTLIADELAKWKLMGVVDPAANISCNTFFESIKQLALKNLLVEKGIITQEELELEFKKEMLNNLREAREGLSKVRMAEITKGLFN